MKDKNFSQVGEYEVRNVRIEKALRYLARFIQDAIPVNWGYMLLLFEINKEDSSLFYISSANRDDVIKAMKHFIEKEEAKQTTTLNKEKK